MCNPISARLFAASHPAAANAPSAAAPPKDGSAHRADLFEQAGRSLFRAIQRLFNQALNVLAERLTPSGSGALAPTLFLPPDLDHPFVGLRVSDHHALL